MTVEVASLTTTHKVDMRDLRRNLQEAERLTQAHASKLTSMLSGIGTGQGKGILGGVLSVAGGNVLTSMFTSITGAMTGAVKAGFEWNKLNEQTAIGFKVMLKDGNKALAFMQQLQAFAKESSLDLPGAYDGAQRLMAMGFEAKEVIPLLRAAGDAAAGLGKVGGAAAAKVDQITLALGQMRAKGKVSAEEMSQQLVEAGIPAWKYLGDEIARVDTKFAKLTDEQRTAKVQKMAERGMLNARTAVAVIQRGMTTDFGGMGKQISQETAGGLESQIGDDTARLLGQALDPAYGKYKKLLRTTLDAINSDAANSIVGGVSAGTGALLDAMEIGIKAAATGDLLGALGLDSVTKFVGGVKDNLVQAASAGASIVQSAVGGGEREQAHASAKWSGMGKEAGSKYFAAFAQGKGIPQPQQDGTMKVKTRSGETFEDLAARYRVSVEALIEANRRLADEIVATGQLATSGKLPGGRELQVPGSALPGKRNKSARRGSSEIPLSRDFLEQAARDPRVQAMLEALRIVEGGQPDIVVGGKRFDRSNPTHPGSYGMGMKGPAGWSTAAGNWQVTQTNWKDLAPKLGLNNFGDVHQQKIAALALYQKAGGLNALLGGNMQGAFAGTQPWAASPYSNLPGGKKRSKEDFAELYQGLLGKAGGGWLDWGGSGVNPASKPSQGGWMDGGAFRSNPLPVTIVGTEIYGGAGILGGQVPVPGEAGIPYPTDSAFDFSGIDISHEQAKGVLDIFKQARGEIIETGSALENLAAPAMRGLQAVQLPALKIEETLENLAPLVNKVSLSMEQRFDAIQDRMRSFGDEAKDIVSGLPEGIGNIFGGAVQQWDGTVKGFLGGLKMGVAETLQDIAAQLMRSAITKFLVNLGLSIFGGIGGGAAKTGTSALSGGFGGMAGHAAGGMIPATAGGQLIQVAEGGFAELVLSTDPKHKSRSANLLGQYMKRTNIIPRFAMGDWVEPTGGSMAGLSSLTVDRSSRSNHVTNNYGQQAKRISIDIAPFMERARSGYSQPRSRGQAIEHLFRNLERQLNQ